jgi:sugar lactone lactonase YvrE
MLPEARSEDLLYVANSSGYSGNGVLVYDYRNGKQVGSLTGFDSPDGECVDAKGDIYVVNLGNGETDEYAYGGSRALKTFATNGIAVGCSVSRSGDLAVTSEYTNGGPGQI